MTFNELYLTLRGKGFSAIESPGVINIISHKTEEPVAHINTKEQGRFTIYAKSKVNDSVEDILRLYANTPLEERVNKKYLLYIRLDNGLKLYATRLWFKYHEWQKEEFKFTTDKEEAHAFDILWLTIFEDEIWFLSKEEV